MLPAACVHNTSKVLKCITRVCKDALLHVALVCVRAQGVQRTVLVRVLCY